MTNWKYETDGDVAIITWDMEDRSMNVMTADVIRELDAAVDKVLADDTLKGAVITSAKNDMGGGVDLTMLAEIKATAAKEGGNVGEALFGFVWALHSLYRKIEVAGADPKTKKGGKVFAAATPGTALGGVFELLLACHRRFAADNEKAKLGLPETLVGLFPGAGGTTRLVRMLGVMGAADYLLQGKLVNPKKAKAGLLIDEIVPQGELVAKAVEWVKASSESDAVKPWDQKGFKLPGGAPYTPKGFPTFLGAVAMTHGKTAGVYPQTNAMLSAVYEGALVDMDNALKIEARWFTSVLMDPRSAAMIRSLFVNKQAIEKGARRPDVPDAKVKKVGIIGAGMMGAGIGFVSARSGIDVVLIDRDQEAADKGRATIEGLLDEGVKRKKVTAEAKDAILARVNATPDYDALKECDLIVEAVFEDPKIKAEVTKKVEAVIADDAIFATNTSTLPITGLAEASSRPDNFIGIHFFSPVHKMMLVEIIIGKKTGDMAVAKALDFVRQIKKTPIVVNDARFFYANRCIIPYLNEAMIMVSEGVNPILIENAAKQIGMPVAPLQLTDETSLELGHRIMSATKEQMGDAYVGTGADDVITALYEGAGRAGRKNGKGFYDYDEKGKRTMLWPDLGKHFPVSEEQPDFDEVKNRLILSQVLEAVRAKEEDVLVDIREGDVGAILGWGFAPWSGGPMSWIDLTGPKEVVAICEALTAKFGDRFEAPVLLREIASSGDTFYGRFQPQQAAA